eukprot:m.339382 g.339382  ORF g.339382 m.339382 type:complete len:471 (-) comp18784_c0_seq1:126-1538(-)
MRSVVLESNDLVLPTTSKAEDRFDKVKMESSPQTLKKNKAPVMDVSRPLPPLPTPSRCVSMLDPSPGDIQADIQGMEADSTSSTIRLRRTPRFFKAFSRGRHNSSCDEESFLLPMTRREAETLLIEFGREIDGAFLFRKSGSQYILSMCANSNLHHFKMEIDLSKYMSSSKGKDPIRDLDEVAELELREIAKYYSKKTRGLLPAPLLHKVEYKYIAEEHHSAFVATNAGIRRRGKGRKLSMQPPTRHNSLESRHEYMYAHAEKRRSKSDTCIDEERRQSALSDQSDQSHVYMDAGLDPKRSVHDAPPLWQGHLSNVRRDSETPPLTGKTGAFAPNPLAMAAMETLSSFPSPSNRPNADFRKSDYRKLWGSDNLDEDNLPAVNQSENNGEEEHEYVDTTDESEQGSPYLSAGRRLDNRKSRVRRLSLREEEGDDLEFSEYNGPRFCLSVRNPVAGALANELEKIAIANGVP